MAGPQAGRESPGLPPERSGVDHLRFVFAGSRVKPQPARTALSGPGVGPSELGRREGRPVRVSGTEMIPGWTAHGARSGRRELGRRDCSVHRCLPAATMSCPRSQKQAPAACLDDLAPYSADGAAAPSPGDEGRSPRPEPVAPTTQLPEMSVPSARRYSNASSAALRHGRGFLRPPDGRQRRRLTRARVAHRLHVPPPIAVTRASAPQRSLQVRGPINPVESPAVYRGQRRNLVTEQAGRRTRLPGGRAPHDLGRRSDPAGSVPHVAAGDRDTGPAQLVRRARNGETWLRKRVGRMKPRFHHRL